MLEGLIVLFVLLWAMGFFVWHIGAVIHLLLVVAVITLIFRLIRPAARV